MLHLMFRSEYTKSSHLLTIHTVMGTISFATTKYFFVYVVLP